MYKKPIFVVFLLFVIFSLFSEEIKSVKKAMLLSAVLPGSGQIYNGNQTKAGIFLASEASIWLAKYRFNQQVDIQTNSYKKYAEQIAGVPNNSDYKKYNLIQNYISSEEYNDEVIQYARNRYVIYENNPELYELFLDTYLLKNQECWDWKTSENLSQYKSIRKRKQHYEIYSNFTISALIINRLISVIDATLSTKRSNQHRIYTAPQADGKGLSLFYEIKF